MARTTSGQGETTAKSFYDVDETVPAPKPEDTSHVARRQQSSAPAHEVTIEELLEVVDNPHASFESFPDFGRFADMHDDSDEPIEVVDDLDAPRVTSPTPPPTSLTPAMLDVAPVAPIQLPLTTVAPPKRRGVVAPVLVSTGVIAGAVAAARAGSDDRGHAVQRRCCEPSARADDREGDRSLRSSALDRWASRGELHRGRVVRLARRAGRLRGLAAQGRRAVRVGDYGLALSV
jgi:hypothetical protein